MDKFVDEGNHDIEYKTKLKKSLVEAIMSLHHRRGFALANQFDSLDKRFVEYVKGYFLNSW